MVKEEEEGQEVERWEEEEEKKKICHTDSQGSHRIKHSLESWVMMVA